MEETDKTQRKLPSQEIDYFKLGKILVSRWYWIISSLALAVIISYIYLWYTPKTYATSGTLKIEEKKSEISDITDAMTLPDRGASKIQSIISVLQSRSLIISAIKDLDYRISFYISGRVRISESYPQKPLSVDLTKFDSLNFYHDMITFKPVNNRLFNLSYKIAGKQIQNNFYYGSKVSIGPTTFSIVYPGDIDNSTIYVFKFNSPDDYVERARGGLRAGETAKNSNIIGLEEIDSNPQFAADILNSTICITND
jgi:tyrosine-protein kinase Etk/Wzc